jgi:hypothetical protein
LFALWVYMHCIGDDLRKKGRREEEREKGDLEEGRM